MAMNNSDGGSKNMTTVSHHYFRDSNASEDSTSISISIIERFRFVGKRVIELGAGTSLPGLVAAKVGAHVVLTDQSDRLEVLDNMRKVCELNDVKCEVMGLTWGVWDESIFSLLPQVILGADVLYDSCGKIICSIIIHFPYTKKVTADDEMLPSNIPKLSTISLPPSNSFLRIHLARFSSQAITIEVMQWASPHRILTGEMETEVCEAS
uniref:uncharacterized protein LOC122578949 isoform X3 n=1 Tax=Erigeron canadensis TaxID=72917 RepID=UPI001CB90CD5|nr:uncharacterized protein LOC122578949 isoform X3 [Erigeron canadensis]